MDHVPDDISTDTSQLVLETVYPQISPDRLFLCFTDPALITTWWPQKADIDGRAGGGYRLSWPDMGWCLIGEYRRYEPGRHLSFTWQWEHEADSPVRLVTLEFAASGEGTRLRLTHCTYDETTADQEERSQHGDGWRFFLGQLQQMLAAPSRK